MTQERISEISTPWTMLAQAHQGTAEEAQAARRELLRRYGFPVYRYLLASVRDPHAADDLHQEFALRFVRGDFRSARPERGRFRDYLKTALAHLVIDHRRRQGRRLASVPLEDVEPAADPEPSPSDEAFVAAWRQELLVRAWEALAQLERDGGQPWYTVLRFRADHPELPSAQVAAQLAARLGRPLTPGWVRKQLHFAREKFTAFLLREVAQTLDSPLAAGELERELIELGLHEYCRPALGK